MKTRLNLLFALCLLFPGAALLAQADAVAAAQARMQERLAQVDVLKAAGQVGEDALGYLTPRADLGPRQAALVQAENADRRILYEAVARRTGQTVEEVGMQRSLRIAEIALPGVWLQRPGGEWYRKP